MTRTILIEAEASAELDAAVVWYEQQRPGLGVEFLGAVDAALRYISEWPHVGTPVPRVPPDLPVRRVPVRRFPYHVVYLETSDATRILAFAHDRRLPGYWYSRASR